MTIFSKLKNFITIRQVVYCTAPAPCSNCGVKLEVPLTRNPQKVKCYMCKTELTTMAIGLVNADEKKLQYDYEEVAMWLQIAQAEREMNTSRLH